jgi:thioredoxin 1
MTASSRPAAIRRVLILSVVLAAVVAVIARKPQPPSLDRGVESPRLVSSHVGSSAAVTAEAAAGTIRLVDLGADQCVPCRAMAPILVELREDYRGVMRVDFIDVWKNPGAGDAYGIDVIPTQIFFDPAGRELFRHQGFFSKADILATWKRLGHDLDPSRPSPRG